MQLPRYQAVRRNFFALWTVSIASYFTFWVMQLALSLFARSLTASPLLVANVPFALSAPTFVLGLFAGALVDRFDRACILLVMTSLRLVTFGLAIVVSLLHFGGLPVLYAIALVFGITQAVEEPAFAACVPMIVPLNEVQYSVLLMVGSLGSVAGALLAVPSRHRFGKRWAIGFNILGNAAMFAMPALTTSVWLVGMASMLGGIVGPLWTIAASALLGRAVPIAFQGRANATYRFLAEGLAAIGPLLGGLLAQAFGLRVTFAICAGMTFLMIIPFLIDVKEELL